MAKEEKDQETKEKKPKKKLLKILIIILVPLLILGGAGYFILWPMAKDALGILDEPTEEEPHVREPEYRHRLPEFTTNLAGDEGGRERYVKLVVYAGYDEEDLTEELERRQPEIRDAVLHLLWGKKAEDLRGQEGPRELKEIIKDTLNNMMLAGEITDIFFWDLVVQ